MIARALLLLGNGKRVLRLPKQNREAYASHECRYSTKPCLNIPLLHRRVKKDPIFLQVIGKWTGGQPRRVEIDRPEPLCLFFRKVMDVIIVISY